MAYANPTITKEQFEVLYPKCPIEKIIVIPQGRIFQEENNPPNPNITFAGRFGTWTYGTTLEHVVKQSIDYKTTKWKNESTKTLTHNYANKS